MLKWAKLVGGGIFDRVVQGLAWVYDRGVALLAGIYDLVAALLRPLKRLGRGGVLRALVGLIVIAGAVFLVHGLFYDSRLPDDWERGMNVTAYQPDAFGSDVADNALRTLAATGTTHVAIVPNWYMDSPNSSSVDPEASKTPTDASVEHAVRFARSLGMEVMLKPHVDVDDGSFRGEIDPDDRGAWFESYTRMIEHYAEIAADTGATIFCVGTELTTMAADTERFSAVIGAARERFDGELTYAANRIDEAEEVGFWDELDLIGIDAYMPLTDSAEERPTVAELETAWQPYVDRVEALHERFDKAVLFTELGYESLIGATAEDPTDEVSQPARADAFEAAFESWRDVDWFRGIYWWDWSAEGLNDETSDGSFRMAGKQAEVVLTYWNGEGYEFPPDFERPDIRLPFGG
ncbi:MAG: glycoside hydrolase family 113 [Solirubrobacterales bacterium]